jgi:very-short-patch-repair endonuclease
MDATHLISNALPPPVRTEPHLRHPTRLRDHLRHALGKMFELTVVGTTLNSNISAKRSWKTSYPQLIHRNKLADDKGLRSGKACCMTLLATGSLLLADASAEHEGVLETEVLLKYLTYSEIRWRISSGRWQRPCKGVVVTQSGPLTDRQALRVALLRAGPAAALAGLTAARLDGFTLFADRSPTKDGPVHVILPSGTPRRPAPMRINVITHYARTLTSEDVHPTRQPRRTRIARSLVDAAAWMPTDRGAMAVLAAGVQQRLVRVEDLSQVVERIETLRRRGLMNGVLGDIAGGAQALSELDFTRQVVRRYRLPEPSRQVARRDHHGRRRWIDVLWDEWRVAAEIDGAQHEDPLQRWDDMDRDNGLITDGYRTLRFPAWLVRQDPASVAREVLTALRTAGYSH